MQGTSLVDFSPACASSSSGYGDVQGSHLGLEIDVSTFRSVKILVDVQRGVLDILGCSEVFYTLFASRLFSRPCATPRESRSASARLRE